MYDQTCKNKVCECKKLPSFPHALFFIIIYNYVFIPTKHINADANGPSSAIYRDGILHSEINYQQKYSLV